MYCFCLYLFFSRKNCTIQLFAEAGILFSGSLTLPPGTPDCTDFRASHFFCAVAEAAFSPLNSKAFRGLEEKKLFYYCLKHTFIMQTSLNGLVVLPC